MTVQQVRDELLRSILETAEELLGEAQGIQLHDLVDVEAVVGVARSIERVMGRGNIVVMDSYVGELNMLEKVVVALWFAERYGAREPHVYTGDHTVIYAMLPYARIKTLTKRGHVVDDWVLYATATQLPVRYIRRHGR